MGAALRVLAVNGSLRRDSYNGRLLQAARRAFPAHARLDLWTGLALIPAYTEDEDATPPPTVRRLRDDLARADALLVATPEYNATVPGALKNAIDWASRPYPGGALAGKPAAVIDASTGPFGAVWAQADLRKALKTAGADVLEQDLGVGGAADAFRADGDLRSEEHRARLADIVDALLALAGARSTTPDMAGAACPRGTT